MTGNLGIALNEQKLINIIIKNPDNILRFDRNYFVSKIASDMFQSIKKAHLDGMNLTDDTIIIYGNKINGQITKELLENLKKVEYDIDDFEKHYKLLRKDYVKNHIENKVLKDTLIHVSSRGELNLSILEELREELNQAIEIVEGKESLLINTEQLMNSYIDNMIKRNKGEGKFSTGDSYLDSHLTMGFAPGQMSLVYGGTNEGKSVFAENLVAKQINKQIPSLFISLENDKFMATDRLISMRTGIPYEEFYKNDNEEVMENILKIIQEERRKLMEIETFFLVEETNLSISDIEMIIKEAKRKMKTDYLICTVDLLTMVREFSQDISAKNLEEGINLMHQISRRQNIHFVNVVQANSENDHKPRDINDVGKCRPNLRNIMNAKAMGHRSRIVFSVFRPKIYAELFFGKDRPDVESMDDIMEIRIEKQTMGRRGDILKYLFDGKTAKMYKIENRSQ